MAKKAAAGKEVWRVSSARHCASIRRASQPEGAGVRGLQWRE
jgi:hypothetical protein